MSDKCPDCKRPWSEHEFGVPAPYCPKPSELAPASGSADASEDLIRCPRSLKKVIVRLMAYCGPYDAWKKNEKPEVATAIIELSNLLREPFTTEEAIRLGEQIGISLVPPNAEVSGPPPKT